MKGLLFWGVCIPLRAWLAAQGDAPTLRLAATVIGGRWVLGYETGPSGQFGGPAFWKEERTAHGLL